jgi:ABC-2 type transport system permease protein
MDTALRILLKSALRDRISLFWSVVLPVGLLIGLGIVFDSPEYRGRLLAGSAAMGVFFWALFGIAFETLTVAFVLSMTIARALIALLSGAVVIATGAVAFGVDVGWRESLLMLPVLLSGTLCFTCLGFLAANLAGNEAQVSMVCNLFSLPMLFVSEAFYSLDKAPHWLQGLSRVLPFSHFVDALRLSLEGDASGIVLPLLVLSGFTALFLVLAVVTFRWDAEGGRTPANRSRD